MRFWWARAQHKRVESREWRARWLPHRPSHVCDSPLPGPSEEERGQCPSPRARFADFARHARHHTHLGLGDAHPRAMHNASSRCARAPHRAGLRSAPGSPYHCEQAASRVRSPRRRFLWCWRVGRRRACNRRQPASADTACVPRTLKAETARARAGCALLTESAFLLDKESEVAIPATVTNEELVAKVTPPLPGAGSEVPRRRHGGVTLSLYPGSAPLPCVSLANAAADWAPGRSQLGVHRPRQRPTRTLTRSASQPTRVLYRGLPLATSAAAGGVLGRFNAAPRPLPSIATDGPDTLTRGASSPELRWRRGGTGSGHLARV